MADNTEEHGTTGHEWDGITELDTPMPRWWLWTFYVTVVWALIYTIAYPAWPLISGATPGIFGYASREEVAQDLAALAEARGPLDNRLVETPLEEIADDPELLQYAVQGGAAVFRANCSQCHGAGAAGVQAAGYPNLIDDAWLWGGSVDAIYHTIAHGIRWDDDPETRFSEMPVFGEDYLSDEEIAAAAEYVLAYSDRAEDQELVALGAVVYEENCAACHMDNGLGNTDLGAPNLTDAIWLYGGTRETLIETITYSRYGVMPAWNVRLSEADIRKAAVYVHQLGGGQ